MKPKFDSFPIIFQFTTGTCHELIRNIVTDKPRGAGKVGDLVAMVGYSNKKMMFKHLFYFNKLTNTFSVFDAMIFFGFSSDRSSRSYSVCPCVIFSYSSINFQIFVSAVSQVFLRSLSAGSHQSCSSLSGGLSGVSQGSLLCRCRHRNKRLVIKGSQIWSIKSFL